MAKQNPKGAGWLAQGPLGPWGRRLGFRWAFPIGTLPVPFHPLAFPLALLALAGWTVWSGLNAALGLVGGESAWWGLLVLAGALGLILSIPVIAWFAVALGGPILQSVAIGASMTLLAIECWQGRADPALAPIPAAYFGLFAAQALFGHIWLRRLERERDSFAPQDGGQATFALAAFDHGARDLVVKCRIARLYAPPLRGTIKAKFHHWIAPADATALRVRLGSTAMPGWRFEDHDGGVLLVRENVRAPKGAIVLRKGAYRAPLWLVTGLKHVEARGRGHRSRLVHGAAQVVRPIPLAMLFHWTSLLGQNSSSWVVGFPRRKVADLPLPEESHAHEFQLLFPSRGDGDDHFDRDSLDELHAEVERYLASTGRDRPTLRANLPAFWEKLRRVRGAEGDVSPTTDLLEDEPELLTGAEVPLVLDWLERARDGRLVLGVYLAGRLLNAFPEDLLRPHGERLLALFNSRKLALQWQLSEGFDIDSLPRQTPIFNRTVAGFGLLMQNPALYDKLALAEPRLVPIVAQLRRQLEAGEPGLTPRLIVMRGLPAAKG